jgi:hypothetical protein
MWLTLGLLPLSQCLWRGACTLSNGVCSTQQPPNGAPPCGRGSRVVSELMQSYQTWAVPSLLTFGQHLIPPNNRIDNVYDPIFNEKKDIKL